MRPSKSERNPRERLTDRYDREAVAYRDLWAPILRGAGLRLLREIPRASIVRVLDVGCGEGSMLPHLRETFPDALVVGVDRSTGMLALSPSRIPTAVMDATHLAVRSASIDLVLLQFMLFHLEAPLEGLLEARRVLRRGGQAATVTWAEEIESPASRIWRECLDAHGAAEPDKSITARHDAVDTPMKMESLFHAAGFGSVRCWLEELVSRIDLDPLVRLKTSMGSARPRFESLSPVERALCMAEARRRMEELPSGAFLARGAVVHSLASV